MITITAKGLTDDEQATLSLLLTQLSQKRQRATIREAYNDGKHRLEQFGFSIPPQMQDLEHVVGWPSKAVESLSSRLHLDGFVLPGQSATDDTLKDIFALNQMSVEWPQAQVSTFIHGAAFGAVSNGDTEAGEPEILIQMMPATEATGIWDVRRRGLSSALWAPLQSGWRTYGKFVLFMQDVTVTGTKVDREWVIERVPNPLPRLGVTPLRYRPRMGRPFGMSRISRVVMSLTDQAVRTMLRTEVSAEFFSSPQRALLGAPEEAFVRQDGTATTAWEAIIGKVLAIPANEDGTNPTMTQFPQMTMQPHTDHLRTLAMMFCGETGLPATSAGIIHDNPASADAITAAWADLVGVAEQCQVELGAAGVEIAQNALMLADGATELPKSLIRLRSKWRNAATPTLAAQTDATVKQITAGVLRPDSQVALEQMGYDQTDIDRIKAEHAAARAESGPLGGLASILNQQATTEAAQVTDAPADSAVPPQ